MRRQECEKGVHRGWAVDCPGNHPHPCPWCEIDQLKELVASQRKLILNRSQQPTGPCRATSAHGLECQLTAGHDGTHRRQGEGVVWTWGP